MRDKMMRVFEAEKAQARAATKGMIFMRVEGSEGESRPRFQAWREQPGD